MIFARISSNPLEKLWKNCYKKLQIMLKILNYKPSIYDKSLRITIFDELGNQKVQNCRIREVNNALIKDVETFRVCLTNECCKSITKLLIQLT